MAEGNDTEKGQLSLWFAEDLYGGDADLWCHQTPTALILSWQNGFVNLPKPKGHGVSWKPFYSLKVAESALGRWKWKENERS